MKTATKEKFSASSATTYKDYEDRLQSAEESFGSYSREEIHAMVDESERQLALGMWQDSETMMRNLRQKYAKKESQIELAEAV